MEPKGSLPCLQEPTTGPYPESDECSPLCHTFSLQILLSVIRYLKCSLLFRFSANISHEFLVPHTCYVVPPIPPSVILSI